MRETLGNLEAGTMDESIQKDNPLRIQDLTFRDGHQSLFATRGRTEDLVPIAEEMDRVGFFAMEVWGGATFDTMHRFLGEDPWERIRTLKKYITRTPFSMLLRGQNLVGYRHYADDVAEAFTERCCKNGIDVFRVFDALNDFRNFQTVVKVIKEQGKHFQGAISYSLTEQRMGGEVYTLQYYLDKAKELEDMGADTICIKDMAGIIDPYDAYFLIKSLKQELHTPIHLHSHFTSGMADMAMLKGIEAGVDIIDVCLSPWAYRTSHPGLEPLVAALRGTNRDTGFDLNQLTKCSGHFADISPKYRHLLNDRISIIDTNVLLHQTPGGMLSNLFNQLKEMDALDKLNEVFEELPRVRRELGQVPLVTPTSQIVGTQTVYNVLFDTPQERYTMITEQVKDLCFGLYGQTPAPIDSGVQAKALANHPRGQEPFTGRPADILEPELDKAREDVKDLAKDIDDVLIYALYPTTGKRFLRMKHGHEDVPEDMRPKTMEEAQREQELVEKARKGQVVEIPELSEDMSSYNVYINNEFFRVDLEQIGGEPTVTSVRHATRESEAPAREKESKPSPDKRESATPVSEGEGQPVNAPMPGTIISLNVQVGDWVNQGDTLLVFEAMKMENTLTAPAQGTVQKILCQEGDQVKKDDKLLLIG
jgi:pyruvate carboxylase subunit B